MRNLNTKNLFYFLFALFTSISKCTTKDHTAKNNHLILGLPGTEMTQAISDTLKEHRPIGIILMPRNISTTKQLKDFIRNVKQQGIEIVSIDCEGGLVNRLISIDLTQEQLNSRSSKNNNPLEYTIEDYNAECYIPNQKEIGELWIKNKEEAIKLIETRHANLYKKLNELGVTHNFAPVIDLNCKNLDKHGRSISENPDVVIEVAKVIITEMVKANIVPVLKHAPGLHLLGNTDTHEGIAISEDSKEDIINSLKIFKILCDYIRKLKITPCIMVNHGVYRNLNSNQSASTDPNVIQFLLDELGEDVKIFCDDLDMRGVNKDNIESLSKTKNCVYRLHCHSLCDDRMSQRAAKNLFEYNARSFGVN